MRSFRLFSDIQLVILDRTCIFWLALLQIPIMSFLNLSSWSRVIPSNISSTLEVGTTSFIVNFSTFLLLRKIWDLPGLAFMWLFPNHLNNLKANYCNSDKTARIFSPQNMELYRQHNCQYLNLCIHKTNQLSQY